MPARGGLTHSVPSGSATPSANQETQNRFSRALATHISERAAAETEASEKKQFLARLGKQDLNISSPFPVESQ